jgi:tellurite resistance protein TehA-like permease
MNEWIEVNGARIAKEYFDANVREAKEYEWAQISPGDLVDHVHCMVCSATIDPKSTMRTRAYKSKGVYLCSYCYDHFLNYSS